MRFKRWLCAEEKKQPDDLLSQVGRILPVIIGAGDITRRELAKAIHLPGDILDALLNVFAASGQIAMTTVPLGDDVIIRAGPDRLSRRCNSERRVTMELIPGELFFISTCSTETQRQFVDAYHSAWGKIPQDGRSAILRYWQGFAKKLGSITLPQVWVFLHNRCFFDQTDSPADTYRPGDHLEFDGDRLMAFPDPRWIPLVIAHELAHVYCFATHRPSHIVPNADDEDRRTAVEKDVRQVLRAWGFDMREHRRCLQWVRASMEAWEQAADK